MKTIDKIYQGKILVSAEKDGKEFKLIKSNIIVEENRWGTVYACPSSAPKYYVVWGLSNSESPGITRLKTTSGRTPSFKSSVNRFYEIVKTSNKINFKS